MLQLSEIETSSKTERDVDSIDLFLCACGYESRARYIASSFAGKATKSVAIGFTSQRVLSYEANRSWFEENDFLFQEVNDSEFRNLIDELFSKALISNSALRVVIDISCQNRYRMAHILDCIRNLNCESVFVEFVYSLALYTPPPLDSPPTVVVEPVIAQFAGWTTNPDKPTAAIMGLGYEPFKAIGVIDHLEINSAVWVYFPEGPIPAYLDSVNESNQSLLDLIQIDGRKLFYSVGDPGSLFQEMNSLVDLLKGTYNPLLIPFGPKIFALVSLLVACIHEDVGVWRVSGGNLEVPIDRQASSHSISLIAKFEKFQIPAETIIDDIDDETRLVKSGHDPMVSHSTKSN